MTNPTPELLWEEGWDGHERAQRRRMAELPLSVKIAWLEEAQRVAEHLERSRNETQSRPDGD